MTLAEKLIIEYKKLPDDKEIEVIDFEEFIRVKQQSDEGMKY